MSFTVELPLAFHILNGFFENQSYVEGFQASSADNKVFESLSEGPSAAKHPHVARWYAHISNTQGLEPKAPANAPAVAFAQPQDDENDIDLFGSDDEVVDEEAEKLKQQRLAEYAAKKSKKPALIAKSMVTLEVKPWDDETDLEKLLESVKSVEQDGLLWGAYKWVPVGYGIKKLQINCVVEDDKVSIDELSEKLQEFEDYIQSVDVAAMGKI